MKTLKKDKKNGIYKLRIEVPGDLWYLADIIGKGDKVAAKTKRRVELNRDMKRAERDDKKTMTLGVKVEGVEFDENVDRLRVTGEIVSGPEDVPTGDHHTLNLKPGMVVTVKKEEWAPSDEAKLKDAEKIVKARIVMAAVEDGNAALGLLKNYGVKQIGEINYRLSGKDEAKVREAEEKAFFKELGEALKREAADRYIVAGPGFTKENFGKYVKENNPELFKKIVIESVSNGGAKGLEEIIQRGVLEKVVKETKIQQESNALKELFAEINKMDGLAAYGIKEVKNACDAGAVKVLLVSNELLRKEKVRGGTEIEEMLKAGEQTGAQIVLVSEKHDWGKQLKGIGGIAAVLRYRM